MSQRVPMRCADAEPYLSPFVDDELAKPLREHVAAHLATCAACTHKVEHYRETKRLLGSLPRTMPSPDVFDRIIAAIPERYPEPAAREPLSGEVRHFSLRRKLSALEQPAFDDARVTPFSGRRTLVTRLLPLVAALLLITLGLLTFARFTFMFGHPVASTSTPVVGQAYEATLEKASHLKTQLGFTPVVPQYFPQEAALLDASAGSSNLGAYLDVTWGFANLGFQVHMREALGGAVPGYTLAAADPDLSWQLIGYQPWRPLVRNGAEHTTAVGQIGSNRSIAMDVNVTHSDQSYESAMAVLRQLTLSTDLPYRPVPVTSLTAAQQQQMVLHYTLIGRDVSNHLLWRADGYLDQAGKRQRIEVTTASGAPLYTDIISHNSVLRLDHTRGTYQRASLAALGLTPWASGPAGAQSLFRYANGYVGNVKLWNVGPVRYQGQDAYDMQLIDAPAPTHVYVSTSSQQVVAIMVEAQSSMQPGGPYATNLFQLPLACTNYTLLTFVASGKVPGTGFGGQVPSGHSSGSVQQTVGC
jgi:hypothetical protein